MSYENDEGRGAFTLTLTERLILANQYLILQKLCPDEAAHYEEMHEVLTSGYASNYSDFVESFSDGLTTDQCREVIDIIDMHRMLKNAYDDLKDKGQIKAEDIEFRGFDGNEESTYFGYAKFLMEVQGKWAELKRDDLNTHFPALRRYQRMLAEHTRSKDPYHLSAQDVLRIAQAGGANVAI